jgi:hypothetical protein
VSPGARVGQTVARCTLHTPGHSCSTRTRVMGALRVVTVAAQLLFATAVQHPGSVIVKPTGLWSGTNNYYGTSWTPGPADHLDWPAQTSDPPANVCPATGGCRGCGAVAPVALSDRVIAVWPSSVRSSFAVYAVSYDTGKVGAPHTLTTQFCTAYPACPLRRAERLK